MTTTTLAKTTTTYALVDAPVSRHRLGDHTSETLTIDTYPDGAVSVVVAGHLLDWWGDVTTRYGSSSWLLGDRFAKGIACGLQPLDAAPDWVRTLVAERA